MVLINATQSASIEIIAMSSVYMSCHILWIVVKRTWWLVSETVIGIFYGTFRLSVSSLLQGEARLPLELEGEWYNTFCNSGKGWTRWKMDLGVRDKGVKRKGSNSSGSSSKRSIIIIIIQEPLGNPRTGGSVNLSPCDWLTLLYIHPSSYKHRYPHTSV